MIVKMTICSESGSMSAAQSNFKDFLSGTAGNSVSIKQIFLSNPRSRCLHTCVSGITVENTFLKLQPVSIGYDPWD